MNILVTGANGQLGTEIRKEVNKMGNGVPHHYVGDKNYYIFTARNPMSSELKELDITNKEAVLEFMHKEKINVVINCAAYTAVDKAESDYENAFAVNVTGPENLAQGCKELGAVLIHISTDYVFDGTKTGVYEPTDETNPQSVYGTTKRMGEMKIEESGCEYTIFRTSWLFGGDKKNFAKTMFGLFDTKKELKVVMDQHGNPTYATDLAHFLIRNIEQNNASTRYLNQKGIYHFANTGTTTWYEFASEIMDIRHMLDKEWETDCILKPCTTEEYPTPAKRPVNSALSSEKLLDSFNFLPRDYHIALFECIQKYIEESK